jgi:hypothetical protein
MTLKLDLSYYGKNRLGVGRNRMMWRIFGSKRYEVTGLEKTA